MKILLVNPPFSGIFHKLGFVFPPLGLAYLAGTLLKDNFEVQIVDLSVSPNGLNVLDTSRFDLVGISGDTCRSQSALEIARIAKKHGAKTVLGGPHASYLDREILENNDFVDFIIRKEGELTLLELVRNLNGLGDLSDIKGITFRSEKGSVVRNEDRPFIADLDTLPLPARHLLPMDKYRKLELRRRKITPIVTSRGCPFHCPFCCSSEYAGIKWRTHSIERILTEIKQVTEEYNFNAVAFIDDTFTINMQRVRKISEEIIHNGIDIRWWCFSRPDIILKHQAILEPMASSGARYIFMGMESGEQNILDNLKKGVNPTKSEEAVNLLLKHGIETMASYMFGDLEETLQSANNTINFAQSVPSGAAQFSILTPFPGTKTYEQLKGLLLHTNWHFYDCTHLVFKHPVFSVKQARKLHNYAYRKFYLTPRRILRSILSIFRGKGVKLSKILPVLLPFKDKPHQ